jgi:NAD(P)-dependent dehydrogenase (short-subunit alcohol dehydrogenase family)
MTEEAFDRSFAVNLKSHWMACKHTIPIMRAQGGGSIVNISSLAVLEAYPYIGYKTMKTAVIALTQNLAMAHAEGGVRVNAILPGLMNTPMAIEARVAAGMPREELVAMRNARVPLGGRMGTAWDVAYAALFLHSDEAQFISGIGLPVDGAAWASQGKY